MRNFRLSATNKSSGEGRARPGLSIVCYNPNGVNNHNQTNKRYLRSSTANISVEMPKYPIPRSVNHTIVDS